MVGNWVVKLCRERGASLQDLWHGLERSLPESYCARCINLDPECIMYRACNPRERARHFKAR